MNIALKKLIDSCTFLSEKEIADLYASVENLNDDDAEFAYSRIKNAKTRIENMYMKIALKHDPTKGSLIQELISTFK